MDRRLRLALAISLSAHLVLLAGGRYRLSYDAYIHMFFADHYRISWWSVWEPRWYAGFSVTSYPPLFHQLLALLSLPLGMEVAFAGLTLGVLAALTVAVYAYAGIFVARREAATAALLAALLPSFYLTAHTFGQIPTLFGLAVALLGLRALANYLKSGGVLAGMIVAGCLTVAAAAHHGTLLFVAWGAAAIPLHLALTRAVPLRRLFSRLGICLGLAGAGIVGVIWPFWVWGLGEAMQAPIDHLSRHNLLLEPRALGLFFLPMYGPLVIFIPQVLAAMMSGPDRRRWIAPGLLFLILFVLGWGGTTPLPRLIYGPGSAWLTYDRFSLWASTAMLPFAGTFILNFGNWNHPVGARLYLTPAGWFPSKRLTFFTAMAGFALAAALLPALLPTQPAAIDLRPVARFLETGGRNRWRYLTFGFGDQMALLARLTRATTIDGSYHTARGLPELRESGIGQIDSARWTPEGLPALEPILMRAVELGTRWAFVNHYSYRGLLRRQGWQLLGRLEDGVEVWENPRAALPDLAPRRESNRLEDLSWGILPLAALALTTSLGWLWGRTRWDPFGAVQRAALAGALRGAHRLAVGVLPVAVGFLYYRPVFLSPHARVYFTYDSALFYLSDGVLLLAVAAWIGAWLLVPYPFWNRGPRWVTRALLGLVALSTASILWSREPLLSTYRAIHLWLMFGLYLSLLSEPRSWRTAAIGSIFSLVIQAMLGGYGFLAQTTDFLEPLHLRWPGNLDPNTYGASVVQLADGGRWLRAYGSLPHPNLLGGLLVAWLVAPVEAFLRHGARRWWAVGILGVGVAALVYTFSRSAWLGLACGGVFLGWRSVGHGRRRAVLLALVVLVAAAGAGLPLRQLILTRMGGGIQVQTEVYANQGRLWMTSEALAMIRARPWGGVGLGMYVIALAQRLPGDFKVEPVHNLALLTTAELGILGGVLSMATGLAVLAAVWKTRGAAATSLSAALVALMVIGLLDHYLWTLAPGRTMGWMMLGAWAGQWAVQEDHTRG